MPPRVLVTSPPLLSKHWDYYKLLTSAGFEVQFADLSHSLHHPEALMRQLGGFDAVLASTEPYTRQVLTYSRLSVVARVGVGYDAIDVPAASDLGVAVAITPGVNQESVAETAIALILGVLRGVSRLDASVKAGRWERWPCQRVAGRTLGLVGFGRTAQAVIPRAQGLGLEVIACDPFANRDIARARNVRLVTAVELFTQSDIVSLHLPVTPETRRVINADTLRQMKRGSVLINTARGALVDELALAEALRSGHLFGAGLDVLQDEPPRPDHPLLKLDNVVFSPHVAGIDEQSLNDMGRCAAESICQLATGGWPAECLVNPDLRPRFRWQGRAG